MSVYDWNDASVAAAKDAKQRPASCTLADVQRNLLTFVVVHSIRGGETLACFVVDEKPSDEWLAEMEKRLVKEEAGWNVTARAYGRDAWCVEARYAG